MMQPNPAAHVQSTNQQDGQQNQLLQEFSGRAYGDGGYDSIHHQYNDLPQSDPPHLPTVRSPNLQHTIIQNGDVHQYSQFQEHNQNRIPQGVGGPSGNVTNHPVEPVDAWIDNLPLVEANHILQTNQSLSSLDVTQRWLVNQNLPRITIPKFDGSPLKWVQFVVHFKEMVHLQPFLSSAQRVAYLLQHLQGDAWKAVQGHGIDWFGYVQSLKRLKFMFGQRASVVQAHLMSVTNGKLVKDETKDLTQFYYCISECISTLSRLAGVLC